MNIYERTLLKKEDVQNVLLTQLRGSTPARLYKWTEVQMIALLQELLQPAVVKRNKWSVEEFASLLQRTLAMPAAFEEVSLNNPWFWVDTIWKKEMGKFLITDPESGSTKVVSGRKVFIVNPLYSLDSIEFPAEDWKKLPEKGGPTPINSDAKYWHKEVLKHQVTKESYEKRFNADYDVDFNSVFKRDTHIDMSKLITDAERISNLLMVKTIGYVVKVYRDVSMETEAAILSSKEMVITAENHDLVKEQSPEGDKARQLALEASVKELNFLKRIIPTIRNPLRRN